MKVNEDNLIRFSPYWVIEWSTELEDKRYALVDRQALRMQTETEQPEEDAVLLFGRSEVELQPLMEKLNKQYTLGVNAMKQHYEKLIKDLEEKAKPAEQAKTADTEDLTQVQLDADTFEQVKAIADVLEEMGVIKRGNDLMQGLFDKLGLDVNVTSSDSYTYQAVISTCVSIAYDGFKRKMLL